MTDSAGTAHATFVLAPHCDADDREGPCEWGRLRVQVGDTTLPDLEVWGYEDAHGLFCQAHGGFGGSVVNGSNDVWLQDINRGQSGTAGNHPSCALL